jgi:hypothetical protein
MSQAIKSCEDSGDNGEWPSTNTSSVPPLLLSRKRLRDKEESSNGTHIRNNDGPGGKTATCSAESIIDLEIVDRVEVVSPNKKRRKRSLKNGAAGKCARTLKDVVGSEDIQAADHHESHEGIAKAASHPMNVDSEQTSREDGSANKRSQKRSNSKPPSKESGRQSRNSTWDYRLSELADYRRFHGDCNVPRKYSENTKLGQWVSTQRINYRWHEEGKASPMTTYRIQALESLGFEWDCYDIVREDRLSELADYRKIHGHRNVPQNYNENTKLGNWVTTQRTQYNLYRKGKTSHMTLSRIQKLEDLGFEWDSCGAAWEDYLSELADYRIIHGHCNVPKNYNENTKLGKWVETQRTQSNLHRKGKASHMTLSRIQKLEDLGFEWDKRRVGLKSVVAGGNVEANTRKDALKARVPWPASQQISINSPAILASDAEFHREVAAYLESRRHVSFSK